jgi:hypothetical protein
MITAGDPRLQQAQQQHAAAMQREPHLANAADVQAQNRLSDVDPYLIERAAERAAQQRGAALGGAIQLAQLHDASGDPPTTASVLASARAFHDFLRGDHE